jgi:hypothetical protein
MNKTIGTILLLFIFVFLNCSKQSTGPEAPFRGGSYFLATSGSDEDNGSREQPWASFDFALSKLKAGDTLTVLAGIYYVEKMIRISLRGSAARRITIQGIPGEQVIINANGANVGWGADYPYNQGSIQIENAAFITLKNVSVLNSHMSGINMDLSSYIDIINCTSRNSFCPGIAAWQGCSYIRILGNTVINANDMDMSWDPYDGSEAPHEAISMAGPQHFEVAYNHVYDCRKEGIDCKEPCAYGDVHHNYVHDCARQGLYIDGWFDELHEIEMHHNVVHDCEAGIAVSSEEGPNTRNLRIHHNLVYDNRATGIFFSRWGADNPREEVEVYNNTFYRNGYGWSSNGDPNYWLFGGCYFFTTNLKDVILRNNIFAANKQFEIGYTQNYKPGDFTLKNIVIDYNCIHDINTVSYPFYMGSWTMDSVYVTTGSAAIAGDPLFESIFRADFRLKADSPAINAGHPNSEYNDPDGSRNDIGAFSIADLEEYGWWKANFPPRID